MPSPIPASIVVTFSLLAFAAAANARHDGPHHRHGALPSAPLAPTGETAVTTGAGDFVYTSVPGWCRLPDERPLGNTHGGIVVDRGGRVYFNTDTERSIMVHTAAGRFVRSVGAGHPGIHGMVLRIEDGEEYIYAAHLAGKQVLKLRLDGSVVWSMGVPAASGKYDDDPAAYNPTGVAVAPNGDVYVADGYGRNWVHRFTKDRVYVASFGGRGTEPGQFRTPHGIALDERGSTPTLIVCDRENRRVQRFDLAGTLIDVPVTGLRRPCAVSFWNDHTAIAELEGRVTIVDGDWSIVTHLGDNPDKQQWARNGVKPEEWKDGIFTAPHSCCFDETGNLYVMDWNATGRISKLVRRTEDEAPEPPTVREPGD